MRRLEGELRWGSGAARLEVVLEAMTDDDAPLEQRSDLLLHLDHRWRTLSTPCPKESHTLIMSRVVGVWSWRLTSWLCVCVGCARGLCAWAVHVGPLNLEGACTSSSADVMPEYCVR